MSHLAPFKKGVVLIGAAIALISQPAVAGDGLFGWIYTLDLQPKGKWEFEQRLQLNKQQACVRDRSHPTRFKFSLAASGDKSAIPTK